MCQCVYLYARTSSGISLQVPAAVAVCRYQLLYLYACTSCRISMQVPAAVSVCRYQLLYLYACTSCCICMQVPAAVTLNISALRLKPHHVFLCAVWFYSKARPIVSLNCIMLSVPVTDRVLCLRQKLNLTSMQFGVLCLWRSFLFYSYIPVNIFVTISISRTAIPLYMKDQETRSSLN